MAKKSEPTYLYRAEFIGPGAPFKIDKMEVRGSQVIRALGTNYEYRTKTPTRNVYPTVAEAVAEYIRQAEQWGQLVVKRAAKGVEEAEKELRQCRRDHKRMKVWADKALREVRKQMEITRHQIDEVKAYRKSTAQPLRKPTSRTETSDNASPALNTVKCGWPSNRRSRGPRVPRPASRVFAFCWRTSP